MKISVKQGKRGHWNLKDWVVQTSNDQCFPPIFVLLIKYILLGIVSVYQLSFIVLSLKILILS